MKVLLPDARNAGDPDADGGTGVREDAFEQVLGGVLMIAVGALDERDRLGEQAAIAASDAVGERVDVVHRFALATAAAASRGS